MKNHLTHRSTRLTFFAVLVLLAQPLTAQTIRDSAGIRIATHSATAQPQKMWRLALSPVVEIGGADGTGPAMFTPSIWQRVLHQNTSAAIMCWG